MIRLPNAPYREMPPIVCMTSDKHIEAALPFVFLMRKYWNAARAPVKIIVAGFTDPGYKWNPEPNNTGVDVRFHSIGEFKDFPLKKWSDAFKLMLEQLKEKYIILMLEDYWPIRDINVDAVAMAHEYMKRWPNTLKFDLAADRYFAGEAERDWMHYGWLDIVRSKPGSPYHMSLMTGMWSVDNLIKCFEKGIIKLDWDPWDIEITGTSKLSQFGREFEVVGTAQWPIKHTLAIRSAEVDTLLLQEMQQEDIAALSRLGMLRRWGIE